VCPQQSLRRRKSVDTAPPALLTLKSCKSLSSQSRKPSFHSSLPQEGKGAEELARELSPAISQKKPASSQPSSLAQAALQRGDYLTHEQVGERLDLLITVIVANGRSAKRSVFYRLSLLLTSANEYAPEGEMKVPLGYFCLMLPERQECPAFPTENPTIEKALRVGGFLVQGGLRTSAF
jgi:hypothetical protein